MWCFEDELRTLACEQIASGWGMGRRPVLFYGGSSFRLWDRPGLSAFKGPYLKEALGLDAAVNLGFGGATIQDCVYCFERLVVPFVPRALLLYAGDNDLARGYSPSRVVNAFRYLVYKTRHYCGPIPLSFVSIKPSPLHTASLDRIAWTNAMVREETARHLGCHYLDVYTPMLGDGGRPRAELFEADGLHLSAAGYCLWTEFFEQERTRSAIFGARS